MEITEKLLLIIDVLYILSDLYLAIREELKLLDGQHGPPANRWQKLGRAFIALLRGLRGMGSRLIKIFGRKKERSKASTHTDEDDDNDGSPNYFIATV